MKNFAFISCVVCLLFLTNCKKEDINNQNNPIDTVDTLGSNETLDDLQIASLIAYDANNVEILNQISEFDAQGRKISFESYISGVLTNSYKNFVYNGLECSYTIRSYYNGNVIATNKYVVTYTDNTYKKFTSAVMYNADNTEYYRYEYDYNTNGVEIGYTYTYLGEISEIHRDYVFQGNEVTYFSDLFDNGTLLRTQKNKMVYNAGFKQMISFIQYNSDNTEFTKNEYVYNSSQKLIGTSFYMNGVLNSINRDYSYNGKVQTFYTDNFSNGVVLSSNKYVVTFH